MRRIMSALFGLALVLPVGTPARADTHADIHRFFGELEAMTDQLADQADQLTIQARQAIIMGGAAIAQNRNTLSGGALGCAAGAIALGGSVAILRPPTAGAAVAASPDAIAMGCVLGALGGASLGYELDHPRGP